MWYNRLYSAFCGCNPTVESTLRTSTNNFTHSNSIIRGSFAYSFVVLPEELKKAEESRRRQLSEKQELFRLKELEDGSFIEIVQKN